MNTNKAITFLGILALLSGTSCMFTGIKDKSPMRKINREVAPFSGISVDGSFEVSITPGEVNTLSIEAGSKLMDKIKTEVQNGVLHISSEGNVSSDSAIRIRLVMNSLKSLECNGASEIKGLGTFRGSDLNMEVTGAGEVDIDAEMQELRVKLDGAAQLHITGKAADLEASLSGASQLKALKLGTDKAVLSLSGASNADVNVHQSISGKVSGASSLLYEGDPERKSVEVTGAGSIQRTQNHD